MRERYLTVLYAQIGGLDDITTGRQAWKTTLTSRCLADLSRVSREHGASFVESHGTRLMCQFPEEAGAATASLAMQAKMRDPATPYFDLLELQVGFHAGSVIPRDGSVYGQAVSVAARVVAEARIGQILTTEAVYEKLPIELQEESRRYASAELKGVADQVVLYELLQQFDEDVTQAIVDLPNSGVTRLEMRWGDDVFYALSSGDEINLGRAATCDVHVEEPNASRMHALMTPKAGQFVLTDTSTNGTWIESPDGLSTVLRRESLTLPTSGTITLGTEPTDAEVPVQFSMSTVPEADGDATNTEAERRRHPRYPAPNLSADLDLGGGTSPVRVIDFNRYGMGLVAREEPAPGASLVVLIRGEVTVPGVVAYVRNHRPLEDAEHLIGLQFDMGLLDSEQRLRLMQLETRLDA